MPAGVQVVKIGAMRYSVAALTSTGAVYTWGYNDYGALGTGDTTNRPTPVQIITSGAVDVDQGAYGGAAVMSDGTIWQWGNNANGEMGTGTAGGSAKVPTPVVGVANAKRVDVGQYHTLYVTNDGNAWGYGANTWNAFLPGGTGAVKPTLISGAWNGQVRQAHAGWDYTQILTTAGDLYAIGYNSYDSLFIGNATNQTAYVKSNVISGLQKVEGFYDNDVALSLDGARISTKGYAGAGGLGNGSSTGDLYGATVGSISLTNVYADGNAYDPTVIGTLPLARRTAMSLPVPVQEPVVVAQQPEAGPEEVEVPAEEAATEAETSAPEEPATGAEEPVEESLEDGAGADVEPAEEHAPSAPGPVTAEQELQAAEVVPES
jgi:alpha-tubulin suppressor-like RCC1 family protein